MSRNFVTTALLAAACLASPTRAANLEQLFIEHVTVLPMTVGGVPIHDATVTVAGGRITSIKTRRAIVPRRAQRIDGRGKFLLPGFTDMHVHFENDRMMRLYTRDDSIPDGATVLAHSLTPYLVNGVLQIFDLSSMPETIAQQAEVESGRVLGPHIATAAMIDGTPPIWPLGMTRSAATPDEGRQAVRDAATEGHRFIKTYSNLSLETFSAIVDESRKLNLRVLGHIPGRGKGITEKFFQPGFDLVAHAEEFAQHTWPPAYDAIPRYVEMAKRNSTWLIATLTLDDRLTEQTRDPGSLKTRPELRYLHPIAYKITMNANPYLRDTSAGRVDYLQAIVNFNRELVRAFSVAGVPVLTGTDSNVPGVVPGFALHDEFVALAKAGMSNQQVLEATTRLPAEWLGTIGDRGTVAVGKRADLVLLDADPIVDIANTRKIAAVIVGGRYLPRDELDRRLRVQLEAYGNGD